MLEAVLNQHHRRQGCARSNCAPWTPRLCLFILSIIWMLGSAALAQGMDSRDTDALLRSTLDRLARRGEIVVDTRPPPAPASPGVGHVVERRQLPGQSTASSASVSTSALRSPSNAASVSPSSTSAASPVPSSGQNTPLPSPFDTSLGSNFTSPGCPDFFKQFLADSQFRACLPFSLLLRNSNSFFQTARSVVRVTQVLDATCSVDFNTCSALMSRLAADIRKESNCGRELRDQNPLVMQARDGLLAYQPLYQAGCLKSSTGSYCFADAITNTSSPSDAYVYFLSLGLPLPGGSRPACTSCLQSTMSVFAAAASNPSQPASRHYAQTAQLINLNCGPNFVNATVLPLAGAAVPAAAAANPTLALISVLLSLFLVFGHWLV